MGKVKVVSEMTRLFQLELKRLFKTKLFFSLWLFALLLSALLAWLPTTYAYSSYTDQAGNTVVLHGFASLDYEKNSKRMLQGLF